MLVEFKVANYRSFREEQTLRLVTSSDTQLAENCAEQGKLRLLKTVGIYGPNASGKSSFIKAADVMRDMVLLSADYQPGKKLPVQPFLFDRESQKKPSTFEMTFYHDGVRYQYGFSATSERIHDEWLLAYPKGRAQIWYERKANGDNWKFGSFLKGEREKLKDKTRDNVLFLSAAAQWNNEQLTIVYDWFRKKLRVMPAGTTWAPVTAEMLLMAEDDEKIKEDLYGFVESCLQDADLGIHGLKVNKAKTTEPKFLAEMPESLRDTLSVYFRERKQIKVEMLHKDVETGKEVLLPMEEESDGTRRFFELSGPWLEAVATGMTVFIDELEASLHPLLTRELIRFFQNPAHEETGAQLIFATHDTTLLDPELFRRDQIWFTEKDEHGGTRLYSMLDYKPRKGEAMQRGYLSGRYGAIPIIEAFKLHGQ
ncbi:MAG: ATP-binding protein [Planctomycetota bacterium]